MTEINPEVAPEVAAVPLSELEGLVARLETLEPALLDLFADPVTVTNGADLSAKANELLLRIYDVGARLFDALQTTGEVIVSDASDVIVEPAVKVATAIPSMPVPEARPTPALLSPRPVAAIKPPTTTLSLDDLPEQLVTILKTNRPLAIGKIARELSEDRYLSEADFQQLKGVIGQMLRSKEIVWVSKGMLGLPEGPGSRSPESANPVVDTPLAKRTPDLDAKLKEAGLLVQPLRMKGRS